MERAIPRRRYLRFAAIAVGASCSIMLSSLVAVDVFLHLKYERTAGLNIWGYRGPVAARKHPSDTRVAVFGGSTAFGYGPDWDGSFPYLLEGRLNERGTPRGGRFQVVNLAYNNEAAYAFRFTMEDYEDLDFDIAVLYEGYNDLGDEPRSQLFRRESPLFRLSGYMPIVPLIFREKALAMLYDGDINRGYRGEKPVFRPGLAAETTGRALEAAAATAELLERQLGRLTRNGSGTIIATPNAGCKDRWRHYCGAVFDAITWARARDIEVLVGTQPYISDRHVDQQNALAGLLKDRFASDPGVAHVNLGAAVDLNDRALAYDGMHLTGAGNAIIAEGFVEPVRNMATGVRP